MIDKMAYLKRAQDYCAARDDDNWFNHVYANYREYYNVVDSVFYTLSWLYDEEVAKLLKFQYCEVKL
jgi:hypothetical protein